MGLTKAIKSDPTAVSAFIGSTPNRCSSSVPPVKLNCSPPSPGPWPRPWFSSQQMYCLRMRSSLRSDQGDLCHHTEKKRKKLYNQTRKISIEFRIPFRRLSRLIFSPHNGKEGCLHLIGERHSSVHNPRLVLFVNFFGKQTKSV